MKIVWSRRISQAVFFGLFLWFAAVTSFGTKWFEIRGWPVNLFLQMDPLVGLGTVLGTWTVYWPLMWGAGVLVLTILIGRFFCGWICPFGTVHHFFGWLGLRGRGAAKQIDINKYRPAAVIKYVILIIFLISAAVPVLAGSVGLLAGLLDPLPLVTRSFHLALLPLADSHVRVLSSAQRFYEGAWLVGLIFAAAVGLNFVMPRFFCRFICPTGALFGLVNRWSIWRIGKNEKKCTSCRVCERQCQGGCEPAGKIKTAECVMCFNCMDDCVHSTISYQTKPSATGEDVNPNLSRRGVMLAGIGGLLAVPLLRLGGKVGQNWWPGQVRPPGSLEESEFLTRCVKCGQCMKVCPTNVIQPAGIEGGIESLWTPVLNNRIGSSGCQIDCVACGYVCPTAAIRPITLGEKLGKGEFAKAGPIKLGTAFVDHGRCLPWSMDKPCLVCQENCPVSPKAIYTREFYSVIRWGRQKIKSAASTGVIFEKKVFEAGEIAGGDHYLRIDGQDPKSRRKIVFNGEDSVTLEKAFETQPQAGQDAIIEVMLQRPYVDVDQCIGCGICEHECPVSGLRAIRVTGEGESRSKERRLLA